MSKSQVEHLNELQKHLTAIRDAHDQAIFSVGAVFVEAMKVADGGLGQLLDELADAEQDCHDHFDRYGSERGKDFARQSNGCQDDWHRCCARRTKAIGALTKFAVARKGVN